jgi:hypothetical protein
MADVRLPGPCFFRFAVLVPPANDEPRRASTARLAGTAGFPISPVIRTPAMIEPNREPPESTVPPSWKKRGEPYYGRTVGHGINRETGAT